MNGGVSHDRERETMEAKVRWFRSLTIEERMELLCAFTDLALAVNPSLAKKKDAQPTGDRIQVLRRV